jgi:general stress protein YciG
MAQDSGRETPKSNRGFASMDESKQREIARKGGQSVPNSKRSFSQDRSLAAKAGRKGGHNVPDEKRSFSQNRQLAAAAGRKGGQVSGGRPRDPGQDGNNNPPPRGD